MTVPLGPSEPPASAARVFGSALPLAQRYAELLAGAGVDRGLLGPREVPRLWDRHLLNCAVITDLVPSGARLVDVGSGAGLPGLVCAIRRTDLRVDLVDSLQRRTDFLDEAVADLGLEDRVRVIRGRAEEPAIRQLVGGTEWVTARAVAPLDRLVRWCLPLLASGGSLLALKGAQAAAEVRAAQATIHRNAGAEVSVVTCGEGVIAEPATVVVVRYRAARSVARRKGAG